jgi:hypothetical protein
VSAPGKLVTVHGGPGWGGYFVRRQHVYGTATVGPQLAEPIEAIAGGAAVGFVSEGSQGLRVEVDQSGGIGVDGNPWEVLLPGAMAAGLRVGRNRATVWTADGRVVALDTAAGHVLARFATLA